MPVYEIKQFYITKTKIMKPIRFSIIALSLLSVFFTSCGKKCDMPDAVKVDAGADQTVLLPATTATLTGTVTSGLTPNTTYLWSELSGPNTATISSNNSATTSASNLVLGTYSFQFQATNDAGSVGLDTTTIIVSGNKTIIIQPGLLSGENAEGVYIPGWQDGNGVYGNTDSLLRISDWTYYGGGYGEGWSCAFIKFTALDTLPVGSTILSAKLTLYGVTTPSIQYYGNSSYPGSPYGTDNSLWLQRATADWDASTFSYNNQPPVTTVDEVAIPESTTQYNYNVTDLDITQMVKDMLATPGTNFGFGMHLQVQEFYREMDFLSCSARPDSSVGPKLVVVYK
jgi:hypothetical protein